MFPIVSPEIVTNDTIDTDAKNTTSDKTEK